MARLVLFGLLAVAAHAKEWTDKEVLALAYDPKYRLPKGFSVDPLLAPGRRFYCHQKHWVTEDRAKARRMVEKLLARSNIPPADKKIVEAKVGPRGYDFRAGKTWFRVHRPTWFRWTKHWVAFFPDPKGKPKILGTLNARPIDARGVREFAEYDWLWRNRGTTGHKVLSSTGKKTNGHFVHVIDAIRLFGGDWGGNDSFQLVRITWRVDRKSGATTKQFVVLRTVKGRKFPG
ncbi:MAG: hypothetical protein ACYTHK_14140 [Planctomycetota bacterium]